MVSTNRIVGTKVARSKPAFVNGVRTNRTGRRTYSEDFKLAVVRECSDARVSLASVAMAHRINANLVRRWVVRHRRALPSVKAKEAATLLPVTIDSTAAVAEVATGKRASASTAIIEIEVYGARIRLRGAVDAASLRSVLDVLAQR